MPERYNVAVLAERGNINIMRVENGWLIHIDPGVFREAGTITPLMVAETAEALADIVKTWAVAHVVDMEKKKARLQGE